MKYELFDGLSEKELKTLYSFLPPPQKFAKNSEIYKSGFLGLLESGKATVKRKSAAGFTIIVRSIGAGEIFGAASLFGNWENGLSSIKAQSECDVIYLSENLFKEILKKFPAVTVNYISFLTDRIRFLNRRVDAFTATTTEQQLYEYFISHSDKCGNVTLDISMSELARRLNVGRTSLYRDLKTLQANNMIMRNGKNIIIR